MFDLLAHYWLFVANRSIAPRASRYSCCLFIFCFSAQVVSGLQAKDGEEDPRLLVKGAVKKWCQKWNHFRVELSSQTVIAGNIIGKSGQLKVFQKTTIVRVGDSFRIREKTISQHPFSEKESYLGAVQELISVPEGVMVMSLNHVRVANSATDQERDAIFDSLEDLKEVKDVNFRTTNRPLITFPPAFAHEQSPFRGDQEILSKLISSPATRFTMHRSEGGRSVQVTGETPGAAWNITSQDNGRMIKVSRQCAAGFVQDGKSLGNAGIVKLDTTWENHSNSEEFLDKFSEVRSVVLANGKSEKTSTETKVTSCTFDVDIGDLKPRFPLKNGDSVTIMEKQQIRAEYRDGKIVRVYNKEAVETLADLRFRSPGVSWSMVIGALALVALGVLLGIKWFKKPVIKRVSAALALSAATMVIATYSSPLHANDGPYCGIYSIYGAASALGVCNQQFEDLIDVRFVSRAEGSTSSDLISAADFLGVKAEQINGLGASSLRQCRDPLILHVSSYGQFESFNHWCLFLGMADGDKCRIADGGKIVAIPIAEILARWDGSAIVVHLVSTKRSTAFFGVEFSVLLCHVIVFVGLLAAARNWLGSKRPRASIAVFAAVLLLYPLALDAFSQAGLIQNSTLTELMQESLSGTRPSFPDINFDGVRSIAEKQIVDVRFERDFKSDHIPSATSLPVDASFSEFVEVSNALDPQKETVVYCQSEDCGFSDRVAIALRSRGFRNIKIFRGGWQEWKLRSTKG